ncbi:MAG: HAD-IB family hydrolase [Comamonadaceae bacterium]|nr:MAG: HAD-IB family hydrolase [Comamonadaceae bacterium]
MSEVRTVAAFDFDGTLTRGDTLLPFLAQGLGWPRFGWTLLACSPWLAGYALRLVANDVAKARLLKRAFAGRSGAEVNAWTARWVAGSLPARLRGDALAQLAAHRKAGHVCVMVSASPDIYLESVARELGFDGLLCTRMEAREGVFTGRMATPNCHGEQKVVRLNAWLAQRFGADAGQVVLHAYGDTAGDKPMLRLADKAWYRGRPWQDAAPGA